MRIGVCTDFANMEQAAAAGFDYIEINLNMLADMPEEDYQALLARKPSFPIPALKSNCFLPRAISITGPDCDEAQQRAYLDKALTRAQEIGVQMSVIGSGGARRVPEGWSFAKGWQQLADFVRMAADCAAEHGITIVLEPLRRQECNILNLVSEGVQLCAWLDHPAVGVLGDTHHMISCDEPFTALTNAGDKLMHMHVSHSLADRSNRLYPLDGDGTDYAALFRLLKDMGYTGDVSVEANTGDFAKDSVAAAACLKKYADA